MYPHSPQYSISMVLGIIILIDKLIYAIISEMKKKKKKPSPPPVVQRGPEIVARREDYKGSYYEVRGLNTKEDIIYKITGNVMDT